MTRKVFYLIPAVIVIIVLVTFAVSYALHLGPIHGNYMNAHELQELEGKAAAGDPAAQYALSIYGTDQERMVWLKKSAESGYPEAVVVQASISRDKESRMMLEKVARNGYYPAIKLFARCFPDDSCELVSKSDVALKDALIWSIVSRLLVEDNKLKVNELSEDEKELRARFSANDFEVAQLEARSVAAKITKVTMN